MECIYRWKFIKKKKPKKWSMPITKTKHAEFKSTNRFFSTCQLFKLSYGKLRHLLIFSTGQSNLFNCCSNMPAFCSHRPINNVAVMEVKPTNRTRIRRTLKQEYTTIPLNKHKLNAYKNIKSGFEDTSYEWWWRLASRVINTKKAGKSG